ncbi:MAG: type II toxin-antitoxin system Phd/YefM family antitoxin [Jhaorihella sp.]
MTYPMLADVAASITELKKNPMGTVAAGMGGPVAILNRNQPAFYCVPADAYEAMLDIIEDAELSEIVVARKGEEGIPVDIRNLHDL